MKKIHLFSLALLLLLITSCRKEKDELTIRLIEDGPKVLVEIEMKGVVKDENGQPIAGAEVRMANRLTQTNTEGEFRFTTTEVPKKGVLVEAVSDGYFKGSAFSYAKADSRSFTSITLMNRGRPVVVSANSGGRVTTNGGARLNFTAGSFRRTNGQTYDGLVDVYARWIDPNALNVSDIMPGALVGEREDESIVALATYGMITFELEASNGEPLVLDEEVGARLVFPVTIDTLGNVPVQIPLWFFDSEEEQWLELGVGSRDGNVFVGTANSPGTWNCDLPVDLIFIEGTLINADGNTPASFVRINIEDLNVSFYYRGYTDSLGYFGGYVSKDAPLQLTSLDQCDNLLIRMDLGPYSADTVKLDTILLDDTVMPSLIRVSGQLQSCSGNPITLGHMTMSYPGTTQHFALSPDGSFNGIAYFNCTSNRPDITVTGYDLTHQLKSIDYLVTSNGTTDLGTITVCEAPEDSLSLQLNGETFYHIPAEYTVDEFRLGQMEIFTITRGGAIWAGINNYSGPGIYRDDNYLIVYNLDGSAPDYPSINTGFPEIEIQIISDNWTYVTGTISGNTNDAVTGASITVAGTFRAKKRM